MARLLCETHGREEEAETIRDQDKHRAENECILVVRGKLISGPWVCDRCNRDSTPVRPHTSGPGCRNGWPTGSSITISGMSGSISRWGGRRRPPSTVPIGRMIRSEGDGNSTAPPGRTNHHRFVPSISNRHGRPDEDRCAMSNVHRLLPRLTVNRQFMGDFIAAGTPCFALGLVEERQAPARISGAPAGSGDSGGRIERRIPFRPFPARQRRL